MDYTARIKLLKELCVPCEHYQTCVFACPNFRERAQKVNAGVEYYGEK